MPSDTGLQTTVSVKPAISGNGPVLAHPARIGKTGLRDPATARG